MAEHDSQGEVAAGAKDEPGEGVSAPKPKRARRPRQAPLIAKPRPREEGNTIQFVAGRTAEPDKTGAAPAADEGPVPKRPSRSSQDVDAESVPASVADRFTRDGTHYYFPDGHLAFRDAGRKLVTESENTEVIRSLLEIARARDWQEVKLSGTESFRRAAWQQGRLMGLEVQGYTPTREEQAAFIRVKTRVQDEGRSQDLHGRAPPEAAADTGEEAAATGTRPHRDGLVTGKLLDHGRAPYRFDPKESDSYFVRVDTPDGKRVLWGVDLERAIHKSLSQPQIGETVALRRTGVEPVTVRRVMKGPDGAELPAEPLDTLRYRWQVERTEFLAEREAVARLVRDPTIGADQAVRERPELAGTYVQIHAVEMAAHLLKDPHDRERLVSVFRGALAESIERGEPMPTARLKERARERGMDRPADAPAVAS